MDEKRFWDIIGFACQGPWIVYAPEGEDENTWDEFRWYRPLVTELKKLAPAEIVRFQFWFDQKMNAIYTWDHWGVMYLLTGYQSDNKFNFFRSWLVCMGKKVYEAALVEPDSLADFVDPEWDPEWGYSAGFAAPGDNAWGELGLKGFDTAYSALGSRDPSEITGQEWPEDIPSTLLAQRYPRLAALFGYS